MIPPEGALADRKAGLVYSLRMIELSLFGARTYRDAIASCWEGFDPLEEVSVATPGVATLDGAEASAACGNGLLHRLSELEYSLLEEVALGPRDGNPEDLAKAVGRKAEGMPRPRSRRAAPSVDLSEVASAFRALQGLGYTEILPRPPSPLLHRLTPWGKAYTVVHARDQRQRRRGAQRRKGRKGRKLETTLPAPERISRYFKDLDIDFLDLAKRIRNGLKRAGVRTVGDLLGMTREELLRQGGLGRRSVEEIEGDLRTVALEIVPRRQDG